MLEHDTPPENETKRQLNRRLNRAMQRQLAYNRRNRNTPSLWYIGYCLCGAHLNLGDCDPVWTPPPEEEFVCCCCCFCEGDGGYRFNPDADKLIKKGLMETPPNYEERKWQQRA